MTEFSNIFEGSYNPLEALAGLLDKEKARVLKAIESRGKFVPVDLGKKRPLKIGFAPGDGIGPIVAKAARTILENLLSDEIAAGDIIVIEIPDLTIENRNKPNDCICGSDGLLLKKQIDTPLHHSTKHYDAIMSLDQTKAKYGPNWRDNKESMRMKTDTPIRKTSLPKKINVKENSSFND